MLASQTWSDCDRSRSFAALARSASPPKLYLRRSQVDRKSCSVRPISRIAPATDPQRPGYTTRSPNSMLCSYHACCSGEQHVSKYLSLDQGLWIKRQTCVNSSIKSSQPSITLAKSFVALWITCSGPVICKVRLTSNTSESPFKPRSSHPSLSLPAPSSDEDSPAEVEWSSSSLAPPESEEQSLEPASSSSASRSSPSSPSGKSTRAAAGSVAVAAAAPAGRAHWKSRYIEHRGKRGINFSVPE